MLTPAIMQLMNLDGTIVYQETLKSNTTQAWDKLLDNLEWAAAECEPDTDLRVIQPNKISKHEFTRNGRFLSFQIQPLR